MRDQRRVDVIRMRGERLPELGAVEHRHIRALAGRWRQALGLEGAQFDRVSALVTAGATRSAT